LITVSPEGSTSRHDGQDRPRIRGFEANVGRPAEGLAGLREQASDLWELPGPQGRRPTSRGAPRCSLAGPQVSSTRAGPTCMGTPPDGARQDAGGERGSGAPAGRVSTRRRRVPARSGRARPPRRLDETPGAHRWTSRSPRWRDGLPQQVNEAKPNGGAGRPVQWMLTLRFCDRLSSGVWQ
jgi:hypothetical protein